MFYGGYGSFCLCSCMFTILITVMVCFLVKQTQGTKYQRHIYRMLGSSSFGRVPSEDCTSLSKWIGDDEVQEWKNIVIIMESSRWCQALSGNSIHVFVACFRREKSNQSRATKLYTQCHGTSLITRRVEKFRTLSGRFFIRPTYQNSR